MADDLSSAPTGGSEPASLGGAPAPASAPTADTSPAVDSASSSEPKGKAPSNRDAIRQALAAVETRQPNETEKAVAVLKEGAGADDKLATDRRSAAERAIAETEATSAAAERARKGWETRRANQEKAETETAQAAQIDKAVAEKVAEKVAQAQPEAKPAAEQPAQPAAETKHPEAPKWMTKQAAGEWAKLPEVMREEIVKRSEAFDQGITKYKQSADRWTELESYEKLSQEAYGRPLKETLEAYIEIDKGLTSDPLGTIEEKILKPMGFTLRQVAEHVMGQEPADANSEIAELRQTVADLNRKLSTVTSDLTARQKAEAAQREQEAQQRQSNVLSQVEQFAKDNARFDELFPDMEMFLSSPKFEPQLEGIARLKAAYERAERLKPAPSFSPPAPDIPAPNSAAQTRAGTASVSGAPGSGSNPTVKKPVPANNREAIRAAMSRVGLAHS